MPLQDFGKYKVIKVLGRGGMAQVYQAHDPMLDRDVAVKVIDPRLTDEQGFEDRFRREAKVVASLRHANLVQVYEFDLLEGSPYMVMECLTGGTLKDRVKEYEENGSAMPLPEIARILTPISVGLEYAHQRGLVHRDLKPANILFTASGEPVITDFGIAKILGQSTHLSLAVVGTPAYMSPEQASNKPVDARCDIYSLGVILYEMATGRVPFEGDSTTAVIMQHVMSPPPLPRDFNPAIPEPVQAVILKALAKNPEERYSRATELARAFATAVRGGSGAPISPEAPTLADPAKAQDVVTGTRLAPPRPPETRVPGETERPVSVSAAAPVPTLPAPAVPGASRRRINAWRLGLLALVALFFVGGSGAGWYLFGRGNFVNASQASLLLRFRDAAAENDEAVLSVSGLGEPAAGKQYQVWLLDSANETRRSLGILKISGMQGTLVVTNPEGQSWLAGYDGAEITLEPSPDPNPLASNQVVASGRIPPSVLVHIRHILVSIDDTPGKVGYAVGLVRQARALQQAAAETLTAFQAKDMKKVRETSEGIANLIEGSGGEHFHDLNADGIKTNAGDGFGLFPNGKQIGYLQGMQDHMRFATETAAVSEEAKMHAGHAQICITNVGQWAVELRDKAVRVAEASDPSAMEGDVRDMVSLANRILKGQDVNGNEEVEPIPNEGGALTAYQHAQFMAGITLQANGTNAPQAGSNFAAAPTMDMSHMPVATEPPAGSTRVPAPTATMDMANMSAPQATMVMPTPMPAATPTLAPSPTPAKVQPPTAVPAMTMPATAASVPTVTQKKATVFFEDNFDGLQLDSSKWVLENSAGTNVAVASGWLRMSSSSSSFPYVHTRSSVFPDQGNFQMTLRYRYASIGSCGATLAAGSVFQLPYRQGEQPRIQPPNDPNPLTINLWHEVVWYDEQGKRRVALPGEFTAEREAVIEFADGRYRVWVDGNLLLTSDPTTTRLRYIYFGNPSVQMSNCAWDAIEVDSVKVESF